jgi:hypothetical protein
MKRASKNIQLKGIEEWLKENDDELYQQIIIQATGNEPMPSVLGNKVIIYNPYEKADKEFLVIIANSGHFFTQGLKKDSIGFAYSKGDEVWLNSDKLLPYLTKGEYNFVDSVLFHELIHKIDPKHTKPELRTRLDERNRRENIPYAREPAEFDAFSSGFSFYLRNKYPSEYLLDLLRDAEAFKQTAKHFAFRTWNEEELQRFKVRLYQDIMNDLNNDQNIVEERVAALSKKMLELGLLKYSNILKSLIS